MKKITRAQAIQMHDQLGVMSLGYLSESTLSIILDNFEKLRKIKDGYQSLAEELAKRLYVDKDEDDRNNFFEVVGLYEREQDKDVKAQHLAVMQNAYSEYYALYKKQLAVLNNLLAKEVEVDFVEVDKDDFIKGVVLGHKDIQIHNLEAFFQPMLPQADKANADFSELDSLL